MANGPALEGAVKLAENNTGLGVGLHFNLTLGSPVNPLTRTTRLTTQVGEFHGRTLLAQKLLLGTISRAAIHDELESQFERLQSLGVIITHIDSHQHVHGIPAIFDVVASFCASRQLPMRVPWVLGLDQAQQKRGRRYRKWMLDRMLARSTRRWHGKVNWNGGLGSIFDLDKIPAELDSSYYRRILSAASPGIFELMVHPARSAEELQGLTRIGLTSVREWRYLKSRELPGVISELGFNLRHFGNAWS